MSMIFLNRVNLQQMSIKNQVLVVYVAIFIAFYLTPKKLVYMIYSFSVDAYCHALICQCSIRKWSRYMPFIIGTEQNNKASS